MGSIEDHPVATCGTFTIPLVDDEPHPDPFTRAYGAPPKPKELTQLTFPLVDFRKQVFDKDYSKDEAFMRSHGFTAVKHDSAIRNINDFNNAETMKEVYYPETEELVKRVTGCKSAFVQVSVCRGGSPPVNEIDSATYKHGIMPKELEKKVDMTKVWHKPGPPLSPIRTPHCDSTVLGGRQTIRNQMADITDLANASGIIAAEDDLCARMGVAATDENAKAVFEKGYDGPRYAAYSIWRPMKPVTRDPLALASWSEFDKSSDFVIEPYMNRVAGYKGDWIKEFARLKVQPDAAKSQVTRGEKFYYVSNMQPDEVLFVKLFDTAGIGSDAKEEVGCLHGSPDLGDAAYGETRESVEVRCLAFW